MKQFFSLVFALLLFGLVHAQVQPTVYRYFTLGNGLGYTFYALDGTTGQLRYLNDFGDDAGQWRTFGNFIRPNGKNNLQFAALQYNDGVVFYALDASNGQLYFMPDYGENPGVWKPYGGTVRPSGRDNLLFAAVKGGDGVRFSAIDGDTGQIYYMYDIGERAGIWKSYSGEIR